MRCGSWALPKEWEVEVPGDSGTGVRKFGLLEVLIIPSPYRQHDAIIPSSCLLAVR